jgi:Uma2 family endonuclease
MYAIVAFMSHAAANLMDVDAFLVWAEGREGRFELRDGEPVMMAPERAIHALTKYAAQASLKAGIQRAGLPCRMFPDGMTVRISAKTAFEPDALVVCPSPPDLNTIEIPNPVVVIEVLSPSTAADDHGVKLDGYFSLPSVEHYLILDPDRRVMIWHKRGQAGAIETRILRDGVIRLDPPAFDAEVLGFFPEE